MVMIKKWQDDLAGGVVVLGGALFLSYRNSALSGIAQFGRADPIWPHLGAAFFIYMGDGFSKKLNSYMEQCAKGNKDITFNIVRLIVSVYSSTLSDAVRNLSSASISGYSDEFLNSMGYSPNIAMACSGAALGIARTALINNMRCTSAEGDWFSFNYKAAVPLGDSKIADMVISGLGMFMVGYNYIPEINHNRVLLGFFLFKAGEAWLRTYMRGEGPCWDVDNKKFDHYKCLSTISKLTVLSAIAHYASQAGADAITNAMSAEGLSPSPETIVSPEVVVAYITASAFIRNSIMRTGSMLMDLPSSQSGRYI